jgi:RIO-like serine/threonine protein kinase
MAAKIIKELKGFSGNQILLMGKQNEMFVRKIGNISRNIERMTALYDEFPVPKIITKLKNRIDMEYLHGLDMMSYLARNDYKRLLEFLLITLEQLSNNSVDKDYTTIYIEKLNDIEFESDIVFSKEQLLNCLPATLPSSNYHGDLTLENIIFTEDRGFFLIDCVSIEYDSFIFDIAKLRQDLSCGWFLRHSDIKLDSKLKLIQQQILEKYPQANDSYLLILMLLRVYKHSKPNTLERNFLVQEINKLWK